MTRFTLSIASLFFAAASAAAMVPAVAAPLAAPVAAPALNSPAHPAALSLKFSKAPLGNVMRVFSARFGGMPLTIEADATAPISGDFSSDDVKTAVGEAARQAGLFAIPLGPDPASGFRLSRHAPPTPPPSAQDSQAPLRATESIPAPVPVFLPTSALNSDGAERSRAELLRERAKLLEAAAKLGE
jgi:hypothetical protein